MWEIFPSFPLLQAMLNVILKKFMISIEEATDSLLSLQTVNEIAGIPGKYFDQKV
jgi:hypothetical protein